jgi:hypothetical protein
MAENVSLVHRRDIPVIDVEIGSTDCSGSNTDNGISRVENLRIRNVPDTHILSSIPTDGFHNFLQIENPPRSDVLMA